MKLYQSLIILSLSLGSFGCAVTSGLQSYDVPDQGRYETNLGAVLNVVKLTPETVQTFSLDHAVVQQNYAALFKDQRVAYRLTNGDVLSIQLWAYPEITPPLGNNVSNDLSAQSIGYPIDSSGYIQFPLIGRYKAEGKTLEQVNRELPQLLKRYLKNPDLTARVISYEGKPYSVQGNVTKGGVFYLRDQPISVYTALGLAGGVTELGDNSSIRLIRNGVTYNLNTIELEKAGYSLHKLLLQPDDTLYVNARENQKIYVMGEAQKNQALPMRDQGMTLSDVLGESLGINPTSASASRVYVLRTNPKDHTNELFHLNLMSLGDFSLANQFQMKSNDIVYVDATGLTRWQRVVNQIIPFSNALYNLDRLGQ
ncbi:polysaccharide biosynthesis/export family protein [Acinetobacter baylyi]|uniref:polysaccharide biosynthesis/export family protein n=1 Tax=Acinetobacter baylyi TaxID=202950 RepID=UPI0031CFF701